MAMSTGGLVTAGQSPAGASLLGGLLCPVTGTVNGLLGVVTAGWDDGATTPPVPLSQVAQAIGADRLSASGITGAGVGVALIDSGVVPVPGLAGGGQVVVGPDLSFESQNGATAGLDTYGHGTHMAGIIAGDDPEPAGFRGIAPGAHLVSVKVATHDGAADVSQVVAAVDWVVQHRNDPGMNIRVLNLSYGTESLQSPQVDPIAAAVENAWKHGIVTVVAGGNDGTAHGSLTDPAVDPYVLAVGASDTHDSGLLSCGTVAPFSSRGSATRSVDVVAPGVSLLSLRDPGSTVDHQHPGAVVDVRYFRGSGTSQATAVTSGAVALLLQARPTLTPDAVKAVLRSTATPLALFDGRAEGAGAINLAAAASAWVPGQATQGWPAADGSGLLEASRGGSHVAFSGVELSGERDIMGQPWSGATWAPQSRALTAWSGGNWNGALWTGSTWATEPPVAPWTGASWTGASWTGASWTGASWTGASWTGASWTGASWTGASWTGASWTGASWTGSAW